MRLIACVLAVLAASLTFAASISPTVKNELVPSSFPWHGPKPVQYVAVTNWPAVQTVGGTVNIGNLPFDSAGAVRVSSAPPKQMVMYELWSGSVEPQCPGCPWVDLPTVIDTTGYSKTGVYVRNRFPLAPGPEPDFVVLTQWAEDEDFNYAVNGIENSGGCNGSWGVRYLCRSPEGKIKVRVEWPASESIADLESVRVYLFP